MYHFLTAKLSWQTNEPRQSEEIPRSVRSSRDHCRAGPYTEPVKSHRSIHTLFLYDILQSFSGKWHWLYRSYVLQVSHTVYMLCMVQGFVNCPKIQEPLQNYRRQKDEIKFLTENPQILGAVLQNLVTWTTCNPDTLQQYICVYIQGVTGGTDQTSGGRSLC
jgi:hypothetical protein